MTRGQVRGIMMLWLAMIFAVVALSLLPSMAPPGAFGADKIVHIAVFLGLAAIPAAVLARPLAAGFAMVLVLAVGAGIELAQAQLPGRHGSGADMLANVVGIGLGVVTGRLGSALVWRSRAARAATTGALRSTRTGVPHLQEQGK